jgi:hypothetical protein
MRRAGDPDALANSQARFVLSDLTKSGIAGRIESAEPQRPRSTQVDAVEAPVNLERQRQPARAARQVEKPRGLPVDPHLIEALERLQRPDQHSTPNVWQLRCDVKHEMIAISEVNIGMSPAQKHRAIPRCGPPKMMGSGITWRISLSFNNPAAESPGGQFSYHDFAYQKAGKGHRPGRQLTSVETTNQDGRNATIHNAQRLSLDLSQSKSFNRGWRESIQTTGRF